MDQSGATGGVVSTSEDGRRFAFTGRGAGALRPGDVVRLAGPAGRLLGQVVDRAVDPAPGAGVVLGRVAADESFDRTPGPAFGPTATEAAGRADLEVLQDECGAALPIGTWTSGATGTPARLRAQGFGRHTFLCGQSGSGKTYALGILLEQLHLETGVRIVVLDPNADFVRLDQVRPGVPDRPRAAWEASGAVTVLGSDATGREPLRLRFATMPRAAQAALLRLDPLRDRAEYNLFVRRLVAPTAAGVEELAADLRAGGPDERDLATRMENLGLLEWEVWARHQRSAAEVVNGGSALTVLDLNGFKDPREPVAVCLDLVERLWADRADRTPTLVVLDEAHNLCPAEPSGTVQEALVERLVQIAAEGRKYGLWLLLSTQRPSKLHPQVLSQCDNLVLMRMNSRQDLEELATVFGSVPREMLDMSPTFTQGEALVAGPLVPVPTLLRVGDRITVEGGSDVRVPGRSDQA